MHYWNLFLTTGAVQTCPAGGHFPWAHSPERVEEALRKLAAQRGTDLSLGTVTIRKHEPVRGEVNVGAPRPSWYNPYND